MTSIIDAIAESVYRSHPAEAKGRRRTYFADLDCLRRSAVASALRKAERASHQATRHIWSITEPEGYNFKVQCSCGYRCGIASLKREHAEINAGRHVTEAEKAESARRVRMRNVAEALISYIGGGDDSRLAWDKAELECRNARALGKPGCGCEPQYLDGRCPLCFGRKRVQFPDGVRACGCVPSGDPIRNEECVDCGRLYDGAGLFCSECEGKVEA